MVFCWLRERLRISRAQTTPHSSRTTSSSTISWYLFQGHHHQAAAEAAAAVARAAGVWVVVVVVTATPRLRKGALPAAGRSRLKSERRQQRTLNRSSLLPSTFLPPLLPLSCYRSELQTECRLSEGRLRLQLPRSRQVFGSRAGGVILGSSLVVRSKGSGRWSSSVGVFRWRALSRLGELLAPDATFPCQIASDFSSHAQPALSPFISQVHAWARRSIHDVCPRTEAGFLRGKGIPRAEGA